MGQTNRRKFGELLDEVSQQNDQETGLTDTLEINHSFTRETDYDTDWEPVTDFGIFDKTLALSERRTQGLTAPLTDPREIGRFAVILKKQHFTAPKFGGEQGTSISKVTSQVDTFLEECEITPDTLQLQELRFHASILETAGIPWVITEIKVKHTGENHLSGEPYSMVTPFLEIGIPSSKTGKTAFAEGVRGASHTPFEKELAGYVRSSIEESGYTFYPLLKSDVSHPGVLQSPTSPGGAGETIRGYEHKGIIKSSFPEQ